MQFVDSVVTVVCSAGSPAQVYVSKMLFNI